MKKRMTESLGAVHTHTHTHTDSILEKNKAKKERKINKNKKGANVDIAPKYIVIGMLVLLIIIVVSYFLFLNYVPVTIINYDGYAIQEKVTDNLLSANFEDVDKTLDLVKVSDQDTVFKKLASYYIGGDEKRKIDIDYPIYINQNIALLNISEDTMLITTNYEEVSGYPNFTITSGTMYNESNLEKADNNQYLFLKNKENIYTNLQEMKIKTAANEYTIKLNSQINFTKDYITYYEPGENNKLVYRTIRDLDLNSTVEINGQALTYEQFLKNIGVIQEQKEQQNEITSQEEINNAEEQNTTTNESGQQSNETEQEPSTPDYIEPKVSCTDFEANIYTARTQVTIEDPGRNITESLLFTIEKNGRTYQRVLVSTSGTIEISGLEPNTEYAVTGSYTYRNRNGQEVDGTFYEGKIITKGLDSLGTLNLSFENGEIFSNKVQLINLRINNNLTEEVLKGVSKMEMEIDGVKYKLSTDEINRLKSGESITFETSATVKSNSTINYTIRAYDRYNNELSVENNKGQTRTSKEEPRVNIRTKKQETAEVVLELVLNNKDNANLENYHYIIYSATNEVVEENTIESKDEEISLTNLDPNRYFTIEVYGNYDLEDGKGIRENQLLGSGTFSTLPISSLGYLNLNLNITELTKDNIKFTVDINEDVTNRVLIQLLDSIDITVKKLNEENEEKSEVVETKNLTEEELTALKLNEIIELDYLNLESNTKYQIEIISKAKQGSVVEEVQTVYNIYDFTTLKKPAEVQITNQFVTGSMIDFDLRIEDTDGAVLDNKVRVEFRDENNNLIKIEEIETNKEAERKLYEGLNENRHYKLLFYANSYNEGSDDSTYQSNYLLKELDILTEPGISGTIQLDNLLKKGEGKNLVDIESDVKWYVYPNFNTNDYYGKEYNKETGVLTLGKNNIYSRKAVYDLRKYAEQKVTMSFKARNVSVNQDIYIQNSNDDTNRIKIEGLTSEWKDFSYTLTVDETGYLGFYIGGGNGIEVKELQIELGNQKTSYEPYKYKMQADMNISLKDTKDEITTNDYYVRIYKNDEQITEERYEEITEDNIVETIKSYNIDQGANYRFELGVYVRDRYYALDSQEFTTEENKEIMGIHNEEEYKLIQPYGNYIVLNDLDLTASTIDSSEWRFGGGNLFFYGNIDFNGYTVTKDFYHPMFNYIGDTGVIKNLNLNFKFWNKEANFWVKGGVFYCNYGNVNNVKINVIESYDVPNIEVMLFGQVNRGTIDKFIVNLEQPIYGTDVISLVVYENGGTVKNGYLYGENIVYKESSSTPRVGQVVSSNVGNGVVENVYTLVNISYPNISETDSLANIVLGNQGQVNNVYSVGLGDLKKNPNVYYNYSRVSNSYYFADETVPTETDQPATKLALRDSNFQNNILNSDGAFNVDELVGYGYYPQLVLNSCMPTQDYMELPEVQNEDLPDILSSEVIEEGTNTAKVKLIIHNPSGEKIKRLEITDIENEIISESYADGQSEVTIELKNPTMYLSKYSIMSLTTESALGIEYTRTYQENERVINVDLYREVSTVEDWRAINDSPTENYKLVNDIDFINYNTNITINDFRGKLNGDNYKIKNINIRENKCLIQNLYGEIKNLKVENYRQVDSKMVFIGVIGQLMQSAIVDNVHVKDIELSSEYEYDGVYMGGIVGRTSSNQIIIRNSSVTNFKVEQNKEIVQITLGGIVGATLYETQIENCYIQNIDFNISNAERYDGIGGIAGKVTNAGNNIKNCYSTGNIKALGEYVGGIAGRNNGRIENCYSLVNIETSSGYIGGIAGEDTSTNSTEKTHFVSNNISIGNIYSRSSNKEYVNRIFGSTNNTTKRNYAYKNQLINGEALDEEQLATLLTREELLQEKTYTNIGFDNNWDYSGLSVSILPKLYNTNGTELLPNQEDHKLEEQADIRIDSVEANKRDVNHAEIRLIINNPTEEKITNVEIEAMEVTIERNVTQEGKTYIDILATPTGYYDSYKLTGIIYEQNEEEKKVEEEKKIELQFFKDIGKIEDWQEIDSYSAQNYRLVADLDFTSVRQPNTNVSIGRLVAEGNGYTIKNFTTTDKNIIKEAKLEIRNITFENINITRNINYAGIIGENNATLENLTFKDCKIQSTYNYIGIISHNTSQNISNINLENIEISGGGDVGGFIGYSNDGDFSNIKGNNITINATSNYVGGIFGYVDIIDPSQATNMKNLEIANSNITSTGNYVGGISGQGRAAESKVTNTEVKGADYVGGMIGYNTEAQTWATVADANNVCEKVTVRGNNRIGGIYGWSNSRAEGLFLIDSEVIGTKDIVGGLIGYSVAQVEYSGVINSKISGNSQVGGIVGCQYSATFMTNNFVKDTEVEGYDLVGGIEGIRTVGGTFRVMYSNATVNAINGSAGGIIGYYQNANTSQANTIAWFFGLMLQGSEISGTENVGGVIGKLDNEFVFNSASVGGYHTYYLDVDLNGSNLDTISLGFGNFDSQTDELEDLFAYKYSTINGQHIEEVKELDESQVVNGEQLKEQSTYTDRGINNTYFDLSTLAQNKYPIVVYTKNQEGIDLPQDPEESGISLFSNELPEDVEENNSSDNENLPNITTYAVDVDKINIDFDKIVDGTYFTYTVNGKKSDNIPIENKAYTFEFDFKTPIEIEVVNGDNSKNIIINPDDVRRKTSYVGDNWIYLEGNTVILNGNSTSGEYVNLYKGKGLTTDGKVIDITSGKEESSISGISLVDTKAISEYSYNGTEIRTFGTYSLVGDKIRNQIYEVRNGKLSVISSNVQRKIGDNIIDFYNENEYQTILASDGILYDLKEKLEYPSNFENSNISEISVNSDKKEVLVYYDNRSIIIFNYMTGEEIYKTSPKEKVSLFAYIGEKLSKPDELYTNLQEEYEQSKELEEKLVEEPIELYLGSDNASSNETKTESSSSTRTKNESYVTVYNAESDKYEVYKESELLNEAIDNPESETSKIEKVQGLQDYYYSGSKVIEKDNGLVYIAISIAALGISIMILHRLVIIKGKKSRKNKVNKIK